MSALEAGRRIGPYVIEALIAMGGMGEVYRARDERLGRRVALKVVRSDREDRTGVAPDDRLVAEARAAAALRHPNVVEVFDAGFDAGRTYVAMELIEGKPLRAYVGDPSVPLATRKRWVLQIGAALAAAHRAGLVHRDVKPENVLVDAEGAARVLDFGLAKRVVHDTSAPTADAPLETVAGRVLGTVSYMAPEQLAGGTPDAKWDQFAWGLVAYELFTGVHPRLTVPMPGPTAHLTQTPKLPNEIVPELPFGDAAAVMLAMAPDAARRFPSMDAALAALEGGAPVMPQVAARLPEISDVGGAAAHVTRASVPRASVRPARPRWPVAIAVVLAALGGVWVGRSFHSDTARVAAAATASSASIVAPLVTILARPSAAPVASTTPTPTASAPASHARAQATHPVDYSTSCECIDYLGPLCPFGSPMRERTCQCHHDDGSQIFQDRAFTVFNFVGTESQGQACSGFDVNGPTSGHFADCSYVCPSRAYAGIHRTPCRGLGIYDAKPREGLLYCSF